MQHIGVKEEKEELVGKATATTWLAVTLSHNTTAHGVRDVSLHILTP